MSVLAAIGANKALASLARLFPIGEEGEAGIADFAIIFTNLE